MPDKKKGKSHDSYDDRPLSNPLVPRNIRKSPEKAAAVAIKHDRAEGVNKSRIVAAGREKIAERILEIAFESGVLVREDPALAEMLSTLEVESLIPDEAFVAVAEILSQVYKAHGHDDPFNAPPQDDEHSSKNENEG